MRITAIKISNIRGFQELPKIEFSERINIFVGPNNSGKSTILNCIFLLQRDVLGLNDITIGHDEGSIELYYSGMHLPSIPHYQNVDKILFIYNSKGSHRFFGQKDGTRIGTPKVIPSQEPNNLIYPYLSKRKAINYDSQINEQNANSVTGNFVHLYSKIDRLITPQYKVGNKQYLEACNNILGFEISTIAKGSGKQAVYFVHELENIPITAMGEGVANILGLVTDLCIAKDNIFIIEEPENDIHPKALKALLNLIIEKSSNNQFFISTHSNIVMKYLGGVAESIVFHVTNDARDKTRQNLFLSDIKPIPNSPDERRKVLEDLGYDLFDFDLWKAWLFLEESSAEVIIRDYLIDWFVKPLKNKIRTFSAGGITNIIPKFDDFDKLFVFLNLEPTYKNRVWVLVDGGIEEKNIIQKMKDKYVQSGWNETNFSQLEEHDFEKYYPNIFKQEIERTLLIKDKNLKREAKRNLLNEVIKWIQKDETKAKEEFKISADEIIEFLKSINKQINK